MSKLQQQSSLIELCVILLFLPFCRSKPPSIWIAYYCYQYHNYQQLWKKGTGKIEEASLLVSVLHSHLNSQRAGSRAWHLKALLVNIRVNKATLNLLRFKGFSPLFLRPQEGTLLDTGWVSGWWEGMGETTHSVLDLLSEIKGYSTQWEESILKQSRVWAN